MLVKFRMAYSFIHYEIFSKTKYFNVDFKIVGEAWKFSADSEYESFLGVRMVIVNNLRVKPKTTKRRDSWKS